MTTASHHGQSIGVPRSGWKISRRFPEVFFGLLLAMGLLDNQSSYIFIPFILALSLGAGNVKSTRNTALWWSSIVLVLFGSMMGFFNGNEPIFIAKFAAPIFCFALFSRAQNLGVSFINHRGFINVIAFFFSLYVFLLTVLSLNETSLAVLKGWSLSFSNGSAVGIWHYFALPFAGSCIYEAIYLRRTSNTVLHAAIGMATIILLWFTTATSAFKLACLVMLLTMFLPRFRFTSMSRIITVLIVVLLVDYGTFQIISGFLLSLLTSNLSDDGDLIRLVQIRYFIQNIDIFGSGFGAEHDFFFESAQRNLSHDAFPYASELPILNLIHGGGLPAFLWFLFIFLASVSLFKHVMNSGDKDRRLMSFFGLSCMLVLVGSIANPFLFSPASMMLLSMGFNLDDQLNMPNLDRRS